MKTPYYPPVATAKAARFKQHASRHCYELAAAANNTAAARRHLRAWQHWRTVGRRLGA